ncbi:MAG: hypothetical protein JO007_10890 [Alphaproteobacteria bacterium]|nr:hypothetical protein [Alphaproteobacteria bacterium]
MRQVGGFGAPSARYAARHRGGIEGLPGRRMRLLEVIDFADMLGRMGELEADALAVPAGRKPAPFDDRHFVRHVGMRGIVGDGVDGVSVRFVQNHTLTVFRYFSWRCLFGQVLKEDI